MSSYIFVAVLLIIIVAALNYFVGWMVVKNPESISGFEFGEEKEGKVNQELVKLLSNSMKISGLVTLVVGLVGIFLENKTLFFISLILPMVLAIIYVYVKKPKEVNASGKMGIWISIITTVAVLGFFGYVMMADLKADFGEKSVKIGGMYGNVISYEDIMGVSLENELPKLASRDNGVDIGITKLGKFSGEGGQKLMLFVHSDDKCVRFDCKDGKTYYLSAKEDGRTSEIFEELRDKIGK